MPSGDAQRQWFPEMVGLFFRQQWHPGLSLAGLALLAAPPGHHASANKKRPQYHFLQCSRVQNAVNASARCFGRISVNATILAAGRFRVAPEADIKELSKRWKKYRKEHDLDHYGRKAGITTA